MFAVAPAVPTGYQIGAGNALFNHWWLSNTESDLKDYRIFYSTFSGALGTKTLGYTIAKDTAYLRDVGGIVNGMTYYFQITARNNSLEESAGSGEVSALPDAGGDNSGPGDATGLGSADVPSDQGTTLRLSWTANVAGDMKDYRIFRATFSGPVTMKKTLATIAHPGTTHQDGGLPPGTTYYYQFYARDTSLNVSAASTEASAWPADETAPAAPVGLGAADVPADQGFAMRLSWTANSESDLKDYAVHRATFSGSLATKGFLTAVAAPGTTHQDAGLSTGATFYYMLAARDTSLNASSQSGEASASPADNLAPAAPAGFAVSGSTNMALLSWVANTEGDLKDYRVRRATFAGGATGAPVLAAIAAPGTTHQDSGLTNDTTYYYQLTARDTTGNESLGSADVSALPRMNPDTTPPAAPVGPGAVDVPGDQGGLLRLSWTANTETDLKDYRLWRSTFASVVAQKALAVTVTQPGTTHQDGGLTTETTFYYRVTARDTNSNESAGSAEVSAYPVDNLVPMAPTGLGVTDPGTGGILNLSWTGNTESDLKNYGVYRATTAGGSGDPPLQRIAGPGTTHQDAGLTNGATFYYRLTARDMNLNESGGSGEVSGYPSDVTAPAAPTGLTATAAPAGGVLNLSWNSNTESDMKDYGIYRATFGGAGLQAGPVARVFAPGTTHQDRTLTNDTTYYYRLTARDGSLNESAASAEVSALPKDTAPPAVPGGLKVTDPGTVSRLDLTWNGNTEVDLKEYRVYRSTASGGSGDPPLQGVVATISAGNQNLTDTGLAAGATYYYRLTARDVVGNESAGSAEFSGMPSRSVSDVTIAQPNATTTLVITPPTGEIRVELPPGTFPDPTSIAVMVATGSLPTNANPPPGVTLRTLPIAISITAGTRLQPAKPVALTVSYRDQDLPPDAKAQRLKIARYDDNRRQWIVLDDSSVNTAKRQVKATTTHFSLFALVELVPASDLSQVVVYPNPWQPGSKGAYDRAVVVVSGLVPQARVRIYTMTGRFIRELVPADAGGTTLWDGMNDSGEAVASGVYFVVADAPGQAVVRKRVAVER